MNYIAFVKNTIRKVFMAAHESGNYLSRFQYAFRHVHIKIKNYDFATLLFGFTKSGLNTVLTFYTFPVSKFPIDSVFRVFMPDNQQMFIDAYIHIYKTM